MANISDIELPKPWRWKINRRSRRNDLIICDREQTTVEISATLTGLEIEDVDRLIKHLKGMK